MKPAWLFGIEVGVQNAVGAEAYGLYYALFNFTFLFNILLDMGINNYQRATVAKDPEKGAGDFVQLAVLKVLLAAGYIIFTSVTAFAVGYPPGYWVFIALLMLNQVLSAYLLLFRATIAGLHYFLRDSILSVADRLLLIVMLGYFLLADPESITMEWFVLAQTGAYVFAIVLAIGLLPGASVLKSFRFDWSAFLPVVKRTYPYGLLVLFMTGYHKMDGIMLERMLPNGEEAAGIYAQAYRLLDAGNNFAFLYAGLLLPMFARLLTSSRSQTSSLANQASILLVAPAGVLACLVLFWGDELMALLYDEHANLSAKALVWLMGSFVFVAVGNVFGTLITASGKLRNLIVLAFITFCVNLALNAYMIPQLGAEGAAIASFLSLALMAVGQIIMSRRAYEVTKWSWVPKSMVVWAASLLLLWSISEYLQLDWRLELLLGAMLSMVIYVLIFRREILLGVQQILSSRSGLTSDT